MLSPLPARRRRRWLLVLTLVSFVPVGVMSWVSPTTRYTQKATTLSKRYGVSKTQEVVVDGDEWGSSANLLSSALQGKIGCMTVVTGTSLETNERIVGIQATTTTTTTSEATTTKGIVFVSPDCGLYADSVATIPNRITDEQAISTLVASLTTVHRVSTLLGGVGGSKDASSGVFGKIVVLGGSTHSSFTARALAALGADVWLITETDVADLKGSKVHVLPPVVGDDETSFAVHLGKFDALIDTMGNESGSSSDTVNLLKSQHDCGIYVSTMTESQRIMQDEGLLFGPGKVNGYVKSLGRGAGVAITPPQGFGLTLQRLFDNGVTNAWKWKGPTAVRTWSLPEFWELTTWPREAGTGVRFGLPSSAEESNEWEDIGFEEEEDEEEEEEEEESSNPFVKDVVGVNGVAREIVARRKNAILFLSGRYCRTCRYLNPQFNRMARLRSEGLLTFAKTDTSDTVGKELSRQLDVDSVPTFVLFREGSRYGPPLSVTRLPSKKLDKALDNLVSGVEWDVKLFAPTKDD